MNIDQWAATAAWAVGVFYVLPGVALAHLTWRELDRTARDSSHFWRMMLILVLRWPQLVYNVWQRRRRP